MTRDEVKYLALHIALAAVAGFVTGLWLYG
jgi:hypothetical protein